MNTQLEKLFEVYNITDKDRHEISQIFSLLPPEKQSRLLDGFPEHAHRLQKIYDDIAIERNILLRDAFSQIDSAILTVQQKYSA